MIDLFRPFVAPEAREAVARVLTPDADGRLYIGEGPRVKDFERALRDLIAPDALYPPLMVNSCTSALALALHLCGVGPGAEVVTTPITCSATNSPIVTMGATPVWADVDPLTGLIDPADVTRKVTDRTRAIMAVDWGGRSCDYPALRAAGGGRIPVIEDAAHRLLGPHHGDYVCLSFQAIKVLTTADGGALIPPPALHTRARLLRWYGLDRESSADFRCAQSIAEVGYKFQSTDVAAAIGLANIPHARRLIAAHRDNARWYDAALRGIPGVVVPPFDPDCDYWIYTILVDDRDGFKEFMAARRIAVSQVHARNDRHPAFTFPNGVLPGVEAFDARQVNLPTGWWVAPGHREYIAEAVRDWAGRR